MNPRWIGNSLAKPRLRIRHKHGWCLGLSESTRSEKNTQHMKKSFEKPFQRDENHQSMLQSVLATPNVHLRSSKILLMLLGNTLGWGELITHPIFKTLVSPWFSTKIPESGPLGSHFNKRLNVQTWCLSGSSISNDLSICHMSLVSESACKASGW